MEKNMVCNNNALMTSNIQFWSWLVVINCHVDGLQTLHGDPDLCDFFGIIFDFEKDVPPQ